MGCVAQMVKAKLKGRESLKVEDGRVARTKLIRTIKKKKKDKGNDLMDKDMRKRIRTRRDTDELKIEKDKS